MNNLNTSLSTVNSQTFNKSYESDQCSPGQVRDIINTILKIRNFVSHLFECMGRGISNYVFANFKLKTIKENTVTKIFNSFPTAQGVQQKSIQDYKGVSWIAELIMNPNADNESGRSQQSKIRITNKEGKTNEARVKEIETINEAIVYYQISKNETIELTKFMPKFITVLDRNGNQINIGEQLEKYGNSVEKLCKQEKFKPAYLIMRDLVQELEETPGKKVIQESIKDLKFVKPSLLGTNTEFKLHGYSQSSFVHDLVRNLFFKMSDCSFAFQRSRKSKWYTVIINNIKRIMTIRKTRKVIESEFEKLSSDQLKAVVNKLTELRESIKNSNYAFSDSSLLFLPSVKLKGNKSVNELEIRLIDMSHAMAKQEIEQKIGEINIKLNRLEESSSEYKKYSKKLNKTKNNLKKFETMKIDMVNSIKEMEKMIQDVLTKNYVSVK